MSYGSSLADQYTQAGIYTGRILKGEKTCRSCGPPKFDFVVNLQTASALRIEIPPTYSRAPTR